MPAPPRKTALLIGNGRFEDSKFSELTAPLADVEKLRDVLLDPSIGGFDDVAVLNDADFAEAYAAIGSLFRVESSDDTVVLYYSGHGLPDGLGHLYLATQDTSAANLDGTAIPAAEIKRMMGASRSRRQVLILDCCYSGAFGGAKSPSPQPISAQTFQTQGFGQFVLTASTSVELAYEGNQEIDGIKTSLFTHFLIRGLATGEAAREGEELVSVADLYNYARNGVINATNKMQPEIWVAEGQGELVIARNPKPYKLPSDLAPLFADENRRVREGAVRILGRSLQSSDAKERNRALWLLEDLRNREENVHVLNAIDDVQGLPGTSDESAATIGERSGERQPARWWGIVGIACVLAGAAYFAFEWMRANERVDAGERALREAKDEIAYMESELHEARVMLTMATNHSAQSESMLKQVTTERDQARAALSDVTIERDQARTTLKKVTAERDQTRASLDAINETLAQVVEAIDQWSPQYSVRVQLAQRAVRNCDGRPVLDGTGFQCPIGDDWGPVMLAIPSGGFTMGSPKSEAGRHADEDQRAVQIEKGFAIGKYEVTFDEYERFARASTREMPSDSGWREGRRPVINVSWNDAKAYAEWLSNRTSQTYRLPTEAEWEYATRAATTGPFSFEGAISPNKASYKATYSYAGSEMGVYRRQTKEVGSFSKHANAWGLNDVHGNVWEWVQDCYGRYAKAPTYGTAARGSSCMIRVIRGGSWLSPPASLRSAYRSSWPLTKRSNFLGFRLAQDI